MYTHPSTYNISVPYIHSNYESAIIQYSWYLHRLHHVIFWIVRFVIIFASVSQFSVNKFSNIYLMYEQDLVISLGKLQDFKLQAMF